MKLVLVAMSAYNSGKLEINTGVFKVPDDYDPSKDVNPTNHNAHFTQLKEIMYKQLDGFNSCHWMLRKDQRNYTKILSVSYLN